jgi:hypothetical protein
LNSGQRDINFAGRAAWLELHSRRARELLREAFFGEKHPEASARRLSNAWSSFFAPNAWSSFFAPFETKCAVTLIDLRRNDHPSAGDCERPVFARIRAQFIDRHNEAKRSSGINSYRRGFDAELFETRCFKGSIAAFNNSGSIAPAQLVRRRRSWTRPNAARRAEIASPACGKSIAVRTLWLIIDCTIARVFFTLWCNSSSMSRCSFSALSRLAASVAACSRNLRRGSVL